MSLHVRPIRADELQRVHDLMLTGSRGMYDETLLAELPTLWRELLHARRLDMHVFVDDALAPALRIQGVGSGAFVSDAFADALLVAGAPGVASQVMRCELGGRSVILTRAQTAVANAAAGVNVLGLDFAFARNDWSIPTTLRWAPYLLESLRLWLDGWRLRLALRECVGRDLYLVARAMGAPLLRRHAEAGGHRLPPGERRYLMGMTRAQSRRWPMALSSMLFFSEREPRFHFTMPEQDLLLLSVRNHSDDECATQLNVSPHTVKTRWRAIFDHVAEHQPDWFPAVDPHGQRGVERRRHLLAYLARHMEELRPHFRGSMVPQPVEPAADRKFPVP